jgi:hypothetical protein
MKSKPNRRSKVGRMGSLRRSVSLRRASSMVVRTNKKKPGVSDKVYSAPGITANGVSIRKLSGRRGDAVVVREDRGGNGIPYNFSLYDLTEKASAKTSMSSLSTSSRRRGGEETPENGAFWVANGTARGRREILGKESPLNEPDLEKYVLSLEYARTGYEQILEDMATFCEGKCKTDALREWIETVIENLRQVNETNELTFTLYESTVEPRTKEKILETVAAVSPQVNEFAAKVDKCIEKAKEIPTRFHSSIENLEAHTQGAMKVLFQRQLHSQVQTAIKVGLMLRSDALDAVLKALQHDAEARHHKWGSAAQKFISKCGEAVNKHQESVNKIELL